MNRSRIKKHFEEKSKQTIILSLVGIMLIVIILLIFGVQLLTKLSNLTIKRDNNIATNEKTYLSQPVLNTTLSATNSADLSLSGMSSGDYTIKLYRNDSMQATTKATNGSFKFTNLKLNKGDNIIYVFAQDDKGNKSDSSTPIHILYSTEKPVLTISYPADKSSFKDNRSVTIKGSSDPDATVTINGFQAIMGANGEFNYEYILKDGGNDLSIISTNQAGNTTTQTIHLSYN